MIFIKNQKIKLIVLAKKYKNGEQQRFVKKQEIVT